MKVSLIGMGPGSPSLLTRAAEEAAAGAALLAGGAGIFIPLPDTIQYSVLAVILAVMGLLFLRMRHAAARGTV